MDKKNQQSKAQFGTLTAKSDANNDYSQGSTSSTATSGMSGTTSGMSSTTGSTFGNNPRSTSTTSGMSGTSGMSSTTSTSGMSGTTSGMSSQTLTSAYDPNDQYNKKGNQNQQQGNTTQAGQKKSK